MLVQLIRIQLHGIQLMELVQSEKITLLFVSHDLSLAKYFKRIDALSDVNQAGGQV